MPFIYKITAQVEFPGLGYSEVTPDKLKTLKGRIRRALTQEFKNDPDYTIPDVLWVSPSHTEVG